MRESTVRENAYLQEVLEQQERVQQELRCPPPSRAAAQSPLPRGTAPSAGPVPPALPQAVPYRITGFWRWRTVVVPPNVYVVHTRRDHREPLHLGLGTSFRYNPYTDSFLLIPAALQTISINAKCICAERQGVLVQAYVQWIIDDIQVAYRRLDFSHPEDPMRIVTVQLREQAEAAIKDKVATMSIDAVLTDKQPIIEELTHRLRLVAEGGAEDVESPGLGLKIVTVQIKEAVVSSTRLWENLQKPFRAEREKVARLAELDTQQHITARELQARQAREAAELESGRVLAERRAAVEREGYDRDQAEQLRRHQLEQEAERRTLAERNATEMARKAAELELALKDLELTAQRFERELAALPQQRQRDAAEAEREQARAAAAVAVEDVRFQAQAARTERRLGLLKTRRGIENELSEGHVKAQLIARLPEIAATLPKPAELRTVQITSDGDGGAAGSLLGFLAGALGLAEDGRSRRTDNARKEAGPA
jgi:hypothetical protein